MITEHDLQEAIAECKGQKNPNANTCIKLAAFLIIQREMFSPEEPAQATHQTAPQMSAYSYAAEPPDRNEKQIDYQGESEFAKTIRGKNANDIWAIMDELMDSVQVIYPRLYNSVMGQLM